MVSSRNPTISELLYLTTGSSNPVPVSIPFTIKNGISKIRYTLTALPNQLIFKTNFRKRQTNAVLKKVTDVYHLSLNTKPAIISITEKTMQKISSIAAGHASL